MSYQQGAVDGIRGRRSYITEEDKQSLKDVLENKALSGNPLTGREITNYVL